MTSENNEVRIIGIRPAHDTDDFPVSQADKDLLKMTIHLMAYHQPTTTWKKVLCNGVGELLLDLTNILQNPPVEDDSTHTPTSEWAYDHWKLANAHHAKYTNGEAQTVADARILIHKNLATAHQDAPTLINDHKLIPAAHHTKYTDTESRAVMSPLSVSPPAFQPRYDNQDWTIEQTYLKNRSALAGQSFCAPICLPHGVTVTKLILYGYRDDAASSLILYIMRIDRVGGQTAMVAITADWADGNGSKEDTVIGNPIIDNVNYSYNLPLYLDPNDSVNDVKFFGAKIEFTG